MAVATITGAALTYQAIQFESAAADADQQAIIETILVELKHTGAQTQTYAIGGLAARYRRMLAEADVLAQTDPERAAIARKVAEAFGIQAGIYEFMGGAGAEATFDYDTQLQAALHFADGRSVPDDQPDRTIARAQEQRERSQRLAATAVGMLAVLVLLTIARLMRRQRDRIALLGTASAAYAVTLLVALWAIA